VIRWDSIGTSLKLKRQILHILNPRLHADTIIKYMKCLYLNSEMESGIDRLARLEGDYWRGMVLNERTRLWVGHNPYLIAWHVKDLTIEIDYERKLEVFRWTQVPGERYNAEGKVEYLGNFMKREQSLPISKTFLISFEGV